MTLTTAVVGGGTVADRHLAGLRRLATTDLVAVCDDDEDRVRETARTYDLRAYTDPEALVAREDLDWVHLCTPVQTHLELARVAIETGVPVQIETPVTESPAEAERLRELAEAHGVPVSVGHERTFDPAMREARRAVDRGAVGQVRSVDLLYGGESWPDEAGGADRVDALPGGEFERGFPNPIYLLLELGGYPTDADAVAASTHRHRYYEGEFDYDGVQFQYRSADGVLCSGTVVASEVPHRAVRVHGDRGSLLADLVSQTVTRLDRGDDASSVSRALTDLEHVRDRLRGSVENVAALVRRTWDDGGTADRDLVSYYHQFDREARALIEGRQLPTTLEAGVWSVRITDAIRASAPAGRHGAVTPPGDGD